jgi:integrase
MSGGFHCFRYTLASFLLAQGTSPVLIKNLLRWSKISMLDVYGHVMTDEKIVPKAQCLSGSCRKRLSSNKRVLGGR